MDALKFLEHEHDQVKSVFKKLGKASGSEAKKLWNQLAGMLTLHEKMEETHFYPRLKQSKTTEDLILESYEEHHVMDLLMSEINQLSPSDEQWEPKIKVLQENTEHHISEEEDELFPKVRKIWDESTREEVGRHMQQMKESAGDGNERQAA